MRKIMILAAAMFVAFFAVEANAQEVKNAKAVGVNIKDSLACRDYLNNHPGDTLRAEELVLATEAHAKKNSKIAVGDTLNLTISVFKNAEGKVALHRSYSKTTGKPVVKKTTVTRPAAQVTSVVKTQSRTGAVTAKKDTVWYDKTSTKQMSFEDKVAVNRGEKAAIDPRHQNLDGTFRQRVYVSALGGATLLNNGDVHPVVSARVGVEFRNYLIELEGQFSQANYTPTAEAVGRYNAYGALLTGGWKFYQNRLHRSYFLLGLSGGYFYQKTDPSEAERSSANAGLSGKAFVRGLWGLGQNFGLLFEGGYQLRPWVEHSEGNQDLGHGGTYVQAGLNYKF